MKRQEVRSRVNFLPLSLPVSMFGRSKPATFSLYGKRRSRWRLPGWFLWCLFGALAGAASVVYVQERHLPVRLSAAETTALRNAYSQADAERTRLASAESERQRLSEALAQSRAEVQAHSQELAAVIDALPPDPRGGAVEVRAASFQVAEGQLSYDIVLTRAKAGSKPLQGVLQLTLTNDPSQGGGTTLPAQAVAIDRHLVVRGQVPLPGGQRPRQATVQILDRPQGQSLGMRILWVP